MTRLTPETKQLIERFRLLLDGSMELVDERFSEVFG